MEERLKKYIEKLQNIDYMSLTDDERLRAKEDMLIQIGFFQHERLVHLIVTVTFALLAVVGLIFVCLDGSMGSLALEVLFIILLIPYIRHYYILENGVQRLYEYYDKII